MGGSSSGKGISDWFGASFDPLGALFGDSLGFDVDPIGNLIGQSVANTMGVLTGEKSTADVRDNWMGSNWIGDMVNPMVGGKSRQMLQQEETDRMYDEMAKYGTYSPANEDKWTPFRSQGARESSDVLERRIDLAPTEASLLGSEDEELL